MPTESESIPSPALPTAGDVRAAAERLRGVAHRTPVMTSRTLDERLGASVFFKCENLQRGGAFKFRGAYNAVSQLSDEERARGVLAYSSGNHAQAVALTGRLLGIQTVIVMPQDAPAAKIEGTRGYGAEVVLYDKEGRSREEIAAELQQERGMMPHPAVRPRRRGGGPGDGRAGADGGDGSAGRAAHPLRRRRAAERQRARRGRGVAGVPRDRRGAGARGRRHAHLSHAASCRPSATRPPSPTACARRRWAASPFPSSAPT